MAPGDFVSFEVGPDAVSKLYTILHKTIVFGNGLCCYACKVSIRVVEVCTRSSVWAFIFDPSGGDTMKICRANALRLWEECFGNSQFAEDFHGNLMCRDGYGDDDFCVYRFGKQIYCGWNIHHILPLSCGGTNEKHNLICTNIYTNDEAEDKITYWIDDCLYQVKRVYGTSEHQIIKIN